TLRRYGKNFPQLGGCIYATWEACCHALCPQCDSQCRPLPLCLSECTTAQAACQFELSKLGISMASLVTNMLIAIHSVSFSPYPVAVFAAVAHTGVANCKAPLPNAT